MIDPLLQKLVEVPSVSGNENRFQKLVNDELRAPAGSHVEDVMGNHVAKIGSGTKGL